MHNYLQEWADLSHSFDVATGYFEIGALLALDGQWQKLDKLRILMGDEVSRRTKKALLAGVETAGRVLDASIEVEIEGVDEVDSATARDRGEIPRQFSPYYNDSSSAELLQESLEETRVLIATDVLSEGLNLQDAIRLINFQAGASPYRRESSSQGLDGAVMMILNTNISVDR